MSAFKDNQAYWADVARRHHWQKPLHIIYMYDSNGKVYDSVSYDGLSEDLMVFDH